MLGKPCYIDLAYLSTSVTGVYTSYQDYYKSVQDADFIVLKNVYADTGRSVKIGDGIVCTIVNKDSADGVLVIGVTWVNNALAHVTATVRKTTTGSSITLGVL